MKHIDKRTALYRIWKSMIDFAGRRIGYGCYPVDDIFCDFNKFYLWSIYNGYRNGAELREKDSTMPLSPENCFWYRKENTSKKDVSIIVEQPGYSRDKRTSVHDKSSWGGVSRLRLYNIWMEMKRRCLDIQCRHYPACGGKGINFCNEWKSFLAFYEWSLNNGYGQNLSLYRINSDSDFCPENCIWDKSNAKRKKNLINVRIYDGNYASLQICDIEKQQLSIGA